MKRRVTVTPKFDIQVPVQVDGERLFRSLDAGQGLFDSVSEATDFILREAALGYKVPGIFAVVAVFIVEDE